MTGRSQVRSPRMSIAIKHEAVRSLYFGLQRGVSYCKMLFQRTGPWRWKSFVRSAIYSFQGEGNSLPGVHYSAALVSSYRVEHLLKKKIHCFDITLIKWSQTITLPKVKKKVKQYNELKCWGNYVTKKWPICSEPLIPTCDGDTACSIKWSPILSIVLELQCFWKNYTFVISIWI